MKQGKSDDGGKLAKDTKNESERMKMNKNLTMYTRNNKNPNLNQEKKRKTHISFFKLFQYGINAIEMVHYTCA